ncbi:hypothetical protein COLO4_25613 [Corchorus olitorius]|uniref:Uncharacterized protein n=1 Tax=Corchorus olitorius TaxID=93759 RepID=A0A1R3I112_9ROSI|nr:hypothetical protein COLO4_25613 [Corchorus olitorius]
MDFLPHQQHLNLLSFQPQTIGYGSFHGGVLI